MLDECLDKMCLTTAAHLFNTHETHVYANNINFLYIYFTDLFVNIEQDDITETSQHMKGFRLFFSTTESSDFDNE
jgi:hypothetical protein